MCLFLFRPEHLASFAEGLVLRDSALAPRRNLWQNEKQPATCSYYCLSQLLDKPDPIFFSLNHTYLSANSYLDIHCSYFCPAQSHLDDGPPHDEAKCRLTG